jgi:two-component system, NtrC family, nitrogen regulation sensor histidine kinase NtrY
MVFSGLQHGIVLRVTLLVGTLAMLAWMVVQTNWYVTTALCLVMALTQIVLLSRYASRASREIARFLDAIAFDDTSVTFSGFSRQSGYGELGRSMNRVLDQLRLGRREREEQSQYLQTMIAHVPVALIAIGQRGNVQLLNLAARRLFAGPCDTVEAFSRYGLGFVTGLEDLKPGRTSLVRMDRTAGSLHLKAAATDVVLGGVRQRLISLQNIESELTAHELLAWQAVIRVMAHEVMNSLTPISSLAGTARARVQESLQKLAPDAAERPGLEDASEALETLARRSDGLLHFVQNHRRLTRRLDVQLQIVPVRRVFSRLQRLLTEDLTGRDIALVAKVEPETLEISVDPDLLDQALINLVRNAMEALRDSQGGQITLSAFQDGAGRPVLLVADNGPGIAADQREKVFVPFYTTKRQGSGVGLTLVRQIAMVHGASVVIADTPGGGTTVSILF